MVAKQSRRQQVSPEKRRRASSSTANGGAKQQPAATLSATVEDPRTAKRNPSSPRTPKPSRRGKLSAAEIAAIFRTFHDIEPNPKGELEHSNPFTLLVAVVLSAQATDAGVNKATRGLFRLADTPQKMVALGEDKVREAIRTIGLFRNKAKNVVALSQQLIARHGGEVPIDLEALEALPGVGRKTANVVLNVAFGQPTMAVDTHVLRVSNRIGLASGKTPLAVEKELVAAIPREYGVPAHHWLILHGRYLCKARKPECYRCPIRDICRFEPKTATASTRK